MTANILVAKIATICCVTLVSLLNKQALINEQGGIFQKFDKRAGSNNQAGRNFHSIIINEQALINKQVEIIHKF